MRVVAAAALAALFLTSTAKAQPDKRLFIIANDADGYGVDRCLASNAACGTMVANAYCHSHEYAQALSFRKVDGQDISGAIATNQSGPSCSGRSCSEYVAIECSR